MKIFRYLPRWMWLMLAALLCSVLFSAAIFLYSRYGVDDAERLRNSVQMIALGAEQKTARLIMTEIAADYHDQFGLDREALYSHVRYWVAHNLSTDITVELSAMEITVAPEVPTAVVKVTVNGNEPIQRVLKYFGAPTAQRLQLDYAKNADGKWQIISCRKAGAAP